MAIYELTKSGIQIVEQTRFGLEGIKERSDLQKLLRANVGVVSPDTMIIAEEYGSWDDSKRRIDLLGLDSDANLVIIELKRTEDGGHMELQAIRYAAMVSAMTFDQVVEARRDFQRINEIDGDPTQSILEFLGWDEPDEDKFAQEVRIVLVSSDFGKELTTSVIWLNTHDVDIKCVRLRPHVLDGRVLLDVQQVIPLPEAAEYQIQIKQKAQKERKSKQSTVDFTRYDVSIKGTRHYVLWKRGALLLVVKALVEEGIHPEDISTVIPWRRTTMWWRVEGEVDSKIFIERATQQAAAENRSFGPKRWFADDDDLIHFGGSTYAFSNQWGNRWSEAMDRLADRYPHLGLVYEPTNGCAAQDKGMKPSDCR